MFLYDTAIHHAPSHELSVACRGTTSTKAGVRVPRDIGA